MKLQYKENSISGIMKFQYFEKNKNQKTQHPSRHLTAQS